MSFSAMSRNFPDLGGEGVRRILRATRKGIRRASIGEIAFIHREDVSPARVCPTSLDMMSERDSDG